MIIRNQMYESNSPLVETQHILEGFFSVFSFLFHSPLVDFRLNKLNKIGFCLFVFRKKKIESGELNSSNSEVYIS